MYWKGWETFSQWLLMPRALQELWVKSFHFLNKEIMQSCRPMIPSLVYSDNLSQSWRPSSLATILWERRNRTPFTWDADCFILPRLLLRGKVQFKFYWWTYVKGNGCGFGFLLLFQEWILLNSHPKRIQGQKAPYLCPWHCACSEKSRHIVCPGTAWSLGRKAKVLVPPGKNTTISLGTQLNKTNLKHGWKGYGKSQLE